MSWRIICVSGIAKLDLRLGFLVVRKETNSKIALKEISTLILESTAISLTNALLSELIKRKVKVIFCDELHNPISELIPYYGSHDTSLKIKQQINWHDKIKSQIWTNIVKEKISNQILNLLSFGFIKEAKMLENYILEVKENDTTNKEGHSAKVYFHALFGLKFTRDDECPINAALNYGYSLLLSSFNREISANGYITQIGLFHDNRFNPFNLGSDLMEIFRPLVDKKVYEMQPKIFEKDEKMQILEILNTKVLIRSKEQYLQNAISTYTKSIFDALNNGEVKLMEFYSEL